MPWAIYPITLGVLAVGLVRTGGRTWGMDAWAWVPAPWGWGLLVFGVLAGALAMWSAGRPVGTASRPPWLPAAVALTVAGSLALAFWLLKTRAHFLGDGYQNLATLSANHVSVKDTARGTLWILIRLKEMLGGGAEGALAAYRSLAVACGALWIAVVLLGARREVEPPLERAAFAGILLLSGAAVLFFGYVENYAPFVLVVTAYTLHGLYVARTGRGRWAAPALVGAAIYFHVLGFALLPSLAWILIANTSLGRFLTRLPASRRWGGLVGLALVVGLLGIPAWRESLTLQFALVPLANSSYVLDGYSLFSAAHLADVANLAFLLLPGGALLAAGVWAAPRRRFLRGAPAGFLGVLILSTSGAVFLLDPKLGMARDWDVFAFAGIPWSVALAWAWGRAAAERPGLRPLGPLAAVLGLLVLVPRVITLNDSALAVRPFEAYLDLDHKKSRNARVLLVLHHRENGREDLATAEIEGWNTEYPERRFVTSGIQARNRGDLDEAVRWNQLALQENPQYFDAYNNLADCLMLQKRPVEAIPLLRIALAINPKEADVLTNLGTAEAMCGNSAGAREHWTEALSANPAAFYPNRNLARLAQAEGDRDTYELRLGQAAVAPEATGAIVAEWGDILAGRGFDEQARQVYSEAVRRGVDEALQTDLLERFPDLIADPAHVPAP